MKRARREFDDEPKPQPKRTRQHGRPLTAAQATARADAHGRVTIEKRIREIADRLRVQCEEIAAQFPDASNLPRPVDLDFLLARFPNGKPKVVTSALVPLVEEMEQLHADRARPMVQCATCRTLLTLLVPG